MDDKVKRVITKDNEFETKAVLIATGDKYIKIEFDNLKKFEGNGISYCTVCDGFFFKNLKVGVLGYNDYAINEALELLNFTNDITIFTNGKELELTKYQNKISEFKIDKRKIEKFEGVEELNKICFNNGEEEKIDGIFVAYGSASNNTIAKKLGLLEKDNHILVNEEAKTNIDGIFAAGDCTGGFKQISVAVGQGAIAGNSIIKYIKK